MNNLKRIREQCGLSQSRLSKLSGVNLQMIQKYEQGVKDINRAHVDTLYKLSYILCCDIPDLMEFKKWEMDAPTGEKIIVDALDFDDAITQARLVDPTANGGKIIE